MSNFRTKLLGLAVLGASMAGVSYGQAAPCAGVQLAGITAVLRAEGQTELVQDVTGTNCALPAGVTNGSFTLALSATPETLNPLISVTNDAGGAVAYYLGTVSGTTVSFTNVAFPALFNFHVYNIRVNASTAPLNSYVTETGTIEYTTKASVTGEAVLAVYGALQVGYTQTSLGVAIAPNSVVNYFTCKGDPLLPGPALPGSSFTVDVTEITPGAFKVLGANYNSGVAGENGSSLILGTVSATSSSGTSVPVSGAANNPTQLTVTLGNIPAGATVYLPITISETPGGVGPSMTCSVPAGPCNVTTLTLEGATAAPSLSDPTDGPVAAFTPTGGAITATYAVTEAWITGSLVFPVPVYVTFAPNSTTAQGPFTVAVAYAPAVAPLTGPPTTIPTFALGGKPLPASIISFCQTTLLFPYVTNATGYETGLAIANTSTDNLLAATTASPNGASFGPAVSGSCSLNFYGNAAQPKAATFPKTGSLGVYTSAGQAPIYASTLTDLITVSGFTGYVIANCNFLDAHGFAFIVDSSGGSTGPEGYLALVIPRNTTPGADSFAGNGDGN